MPIEVIGDSARGDVYAFVRLLVEGDTIVEADAPGIARPLVGLTLLEAAAVPGETVAADALANAIAPVLTAAPRPGRVAVAMSGGVDSAVALHRAGRQAVGVTLRLWLDPGGPNAERACCSPDAVISARETCHARGLPHVTLDLREAFRNDVVQAFVDGYAAGLTPNPCVRCNGSFRFAALVAFAERAGADVLWTGHYARLVERDGMRLVARGADPGKDQSYMLATIDPGLFAHVGFPLGETTKAAVRDEAAATGSRRPADRRARKRASSPAATTGRFSSATGSHRHPEASSTRRGPSVVPMTGCGGSHPASGAGSASPRRSRSTSCAPTHARTPSLSGRVARSAHGV